MRLLFTSTAGYGHVLPLLPLARAALAAGHEAAFATAERWRDRLEAEGLSFFAAGLDLAEAEARHAPFRAYLATLPIPERRAEAFANRFGGVEASARVDDVRAAAADWAPELVVHEPGDLAAPLVGAERGTRSAQHGFGRMVPLACFERAAPSTEPLWREAGLEPEPWGGAFRDLYLDVCPPSLAGEQPPPGAVVHRLRPARAAGPVPAAVPTVYVTLGTVFNDLARFRLVLDGLGGVDCDVVATIGAGNDPAALAAPPNVRVERFVPQSELLPRCAAVVNHGGSGSTLGALAHGLPMLILPEGADQFENADACAAAGAAVAILPDALTAAAVADAVTALLVDPAYAVAARRVAAEIAAMPGPEEALRSLVRAVELGPAR